jgi:hypothetical protein
MADEGTEGFACELCTTSEDQGFQATSARDEDSSGALRTHGSHIYESLRLAEHWHGRPGNAYSLAPTPVSAVPTWPPSEAMTTPVIHPEALDARKMASPAMSKSLP